MKETRLSDLFPGVDFSDCGLNPETRISYDPTRYTPTVEDIKLFSTKCEEEFDAEDVLRELEAAQEKYDKRIA